MKTSLLLVFSFLLIQAAQGQCPTCPATKQLVCVPPNFKELLKNIQTKLSNFEGKADRPATNSLANEIKMLNDLQQEVSLTSGSSTNTPQTYKMIVRGDISLPILLESNTPDFPYPHLVVIIRKASIAAGTNQENLLNLQVGEATWLDRPIGSQEPDRLIIKWPDAFRMNLTGLTLQNTTTFPQFLKNLANGSSYQAFMIYNNSNGSFIVTQIL
ncbi:MAG: hypothetical protein U0Y10_14625 [Spirosomataceae bacterium]